LMAALVATLVADFFLVIHRVYPLGVGIFWFAHAFYALRFGGRRAAWFLPLALPVAGMIWLVTRDLLVALAAGYITLFIISYTCMIIALKAKKYPPPNHFLAAAGMTLFVFCDIFVAIFNLGGMGLIQNHAIAMFAVDAIWLFYAPAQICLALSAMRFTRPFYVLDKTDKASSKTPQEQGYAQG
ncbi:MAG: lysoplasmalogenase, partial [Defluviitaleaceae bacterium]|nr:lysoplasmalogenase [Defluviitaleaceae bacterium]